MLNTQGFAQTGKVQEVSWLNTVYDQSIHMEARRAGVLPSGVCEGTAGLWQGAGRYKLKA